MNDDDLPALRQMIAQAADQCDDHDLLDLVYKLLTTDPTP